MSLYVKINRYNNFQLPGTLWYHDHSMHVTAPNVRNGLAGAYIIYDKTIEKDLPSGKYELVLLAAAVNRGVTPSPYILSEQSANSRNKIEF